ncbi:Stp1/IreP family PP2C-type Ser/Thr phosphatase [Carnobacterium gallinarum]|uniref:Stp1/IreP family PP2C-type Ser/Thr phosphatase n=1 Tax=Carnobacterium gallinarum TaxID=2749 RepID=UPI00054F6204|nr:Stp1/IreP family PP2C-type Ser/Thr phosphatase [Carnobacterium gallinarum]
MHVVFHSDVGKIRKNNQDFAGQFDNQVGLKLVVVCDGMGGHKAGDVASEMAVSHLGHAWEETNFTTAEEVTQWMLKQISLENERIVGKSNQFSDLDGMGTTLVAAVLFEHELVIANIGDSRGYLYSNQKLIQLTEDHSLVNELVKSGEITSEAAANHPRKNVLTRSLGVSSEIDIDITIFQILPEDILLLCSDGLTNMVTDDTILNILSEKILLEDKVESLVTLANEQGGADNITVLLADFAMREEQ